MLAGSRASAARNVERRGIGKVQRPAGSRRALGGRVGTITLVMVGMAQLVLAGSDVSAKPHGAQDARSVARIREDDVPAGQGIGFPVAGGQ